MNLYIKTTQNLFDHIWFNVVDPELDPNWIRTVINNFVEPDPYRNWGKFLEPDPNTGTVVPIMYFDPQH